MIENRTTVLNKFHRLISWDTMYHILGKSLPTMGRPMVRLTAYSNEGQESKQKYLNVNSQSGEILRQKILFGKSDRRTMAYIADEVS